MASVQLSSTSPDDVEVVIRYHSTSQDPIFLGVDSSGWVPQQMKLQGDAYEHVITVPRTTRQILYKFRIGDSWWVHDETNPAEPDNHGGWNNKYFIPELPAAAPFNDLEAEADHAHNDFDEDTELESVAAVESIADTASEAGTVDLEARSNGEPELIDFDVDDPDYPAFLDSRSSSGLQEWLGFGLRSRF